MTTPTPKGNTMTYAERYVDLAKSEHIAVGVTQQAELDEHLTSIVGYELVDIEVRQGPAAARPLQLMTRAQWSAFVQAVVGADHALKQLPGWLP